MKSKELLFSLKMAFLFFVRNLKTSLFIVLIFSLILSLPTLTRSVSEGFGIKIKKDVYSLIGDYLIKKKPQTKISLKTAYNKLNHLPFVKYYISVYNPQVIIKDKKGNEVSSNLYIIDSSKIDLFIRLNKLNRYIFKGEIEEGKRGIILGKGLTKYSKIRMFSNPLEVEPGDIVRIHLNNETLNLKVQAIYSKGLPSIDIYSIASSKIIKNFEPNKILVFVNDNNPSIEKLLKNEFPQFEVKTVKEEMASIDKFIKTFSMISNITFFFGTLIAIIIIYALIYINIREKRNEIGIMRAIGIKESNIAFIYIFLVVFYLTISFFVSLLILKAFEVYFNYHPLKSPVGLVIPFVDYHYFILNYVKLFALLVLISYLPVKSVLNEKILDQLKGWKNDIGSKKYNKKV